MVRLEPDARTLDPQEFSPLMQSVDRLKYEAAPA
jgi:hypothetical protein